MLELCFKKLHNFGSEAILLGQLKQYRNNILAIFELVLCELKLLYWPVVRNFNKTAKFLPMFCKNNNRYFHNSLNVELGHNLGVRLIGTWLDNLHPAPGPSVIPDLLNLTIWETWFGFGSDTVQETSQEILNETYSVTRMLISIVSRDI